MFEDRSQSQPELPVDPGATADEIPFYSQVGAFANPGDAAGELKEDYYAQLPGALLDLGVESGASFPEAVEHLSKELQSGKISPQHLEAGRVVAGVLFEHLDAEDGSQPAGESADTQAFRFNIGIIKGYYAEDFMDTTDFMDEVLMNKDELRDRLEHGLSVAPSFGFIGKASALVRKLKIGTAPPLRMYKGFDPSARDPYPRATYRHVGSPEESPADQSVNQLRGAARVMDLALHQAIHDNIFAEENKHFLSFFPSDRDGHVLGFFACRTAKSMVDDRGGGSDLVARVIELRTEDAGFIYGRIMRKPTAFMGYLNIPQPGLDFMKDPNTGDDVPDDQGRLVGAYDKWLPTYRSLSVVVLDNGELSPTIEPLVTQESLVDFSKPEYENLWRKASVQFTMPEAA